VSDPPSVRLFDPSQLDDETGARARITVTIPSDSLKAGCELTLLVPVRLECARCDGGGCDACGRSGVVRAPEGDASRTVRTRVTSASGVAVRVRIPLPFGDASDIRQLFVEVRGGESASELVRAIEPRGASVPSQRWRRAAFAVAVAIASLAVAAGAWFAR
jgi:hypothetical protein